MSEPFDILGSFIEQEFLVAIKEKYIKILLLVDLNVEKKFLQQMRLGIDPRKS